MNAASAHVASVGRAGGAGVSGGAYRERLLDGMAAAVRADGLRGTTVADVVRSARTSRRTFYEHFASKEACYLALARRENARLADVIVSSVDSSEPWEKQVGQAVEAWVNQLAQEPELNRVWIRESASLGEDARSLEREFLDDFVAVIQNLVGRADVDVTGIEVPTRQLAIVLLAGLGALFASTVETEEPIDSIVDVAVRASQALLVIHLEG